MREVHYTLLRFENSDALQFCKNATNALNKKFRKKHKKMLMSIVLDNWGHYFFSLSMYYDKYLYHFYH